MMESRFWYIAMSIGVVCFVLHPTVSQAAQPGKSISVHASVNQVSDTEWDLTITAVIPEGMHVYGLAQVLPLLATRVTVESSREILAASDFKSVTEPTSTIHPDLGIAVLEHRGTTKWKSRIVLKKHYKAFEINGSVFAQGCADDKCFAPKSYPFVIKVEPIIR